MKTLVLTTIAVAALGAAMCVPAAEEFPHGNQIVCYDPVNGEPHPNPAECARAAGFNSPGDGAQTFTEMGDPYGISKNGVRVTPADIFRVRCVHGDDPAP
jgi:hypothetical protein